MLALSAELFAHKSSTLLAEEGERYSLLASNMNDVITRHGAGGAVLFASPAAQHTFGVSPDELSGMGIFDLVHVQDRPTYLSALAHAAAGATDASAEFRVRRNVTPAQAFSTGQFGWIEMRCRPLPGAATHLGGREVVAVMRDVTARKNQEDALAAARREADKANDAKSRFLATMSHELRTPLNAVIGFSEMLMEDRALGLDGDKRREYAGLIKNSGEHLLAVVNQVLDLSKIESGTLVVSPERCAPTPIVRSSCDLLALKAHEAKLEIQMRFDETIEEVSVDQRALKQMAINLISNAIKFTPPGGAVRVRTSIDHGMFVLSVEDNGIGIPAEDLGSIGSPFYQAQPSYDRRYEGTGLGLSIVKGLAELHGGRLDVASTVGVGTSVRVLIPRDGPPQKIESAQRAEVILLEPQHWSEPKVKQSA
nr:PAS domain-containing sensor histidine kinase [Variibacter gotjawalensis]